MLSSLFVSSSFCRDSDGEDHTFDRICKYCNGIVLLPLKYEKLAVVDHVLERMQNLIDCCSVKRAHKAVVPFDTLSVWRRSRRCYRRCLLTAFLGCHATEVGSGEQRYVTINTTVDKYVDLLRLREKPAWVKRRIYYVTGGSGSYYRGGHSFPPPPPTPRFFRVCAPKPFILDV